MDTKIFPLCSEQWEFLSVLHALENPIDLDVAGKLSPILPAPFLNLLGRNRIDGIIEADHLNRVFLSSSLPAGFMEKLEDMNDKERLSRLIERLYEQKMIDAVDPGVVSKLLKKTGRSKDVAELEIREAKKALKNGDQHNAMQHLWNVVRQLYDMIEDTKSHPMFISATLKLSDLCFSLGTGFMEIPRFLKKSPCHDTTDGGQAVPCPDQSQSLHFFPYCKTT